MTRSSTQRIEDILDAIQRCQRYADSLASPSPLIAEIASDAVERNLQIIGEAANHLPKEITDTHPGLAWAAIRGMRNILVHDYFGVDGDIVRDVIDSHLAPLAAALEHHIDR